MAACSNDWVAGANTPLEKVVNSWVKKLSLGSFCNEDMWAPSTLGSAPPANISEVILMLEKQNKKTKGGVFREAGATGCSELLKIREFLVPDFFCHRRLDDGFLPAKIN